MKKRRLFFRLALLALAVLMTLQPVLALAEESATTSDGEAAQYVAVAGTTIKVRRGPSKEEYGNDSIPKGALVYILSLGDEWCKVQTTRVVGYVQTKYLEDIREYNAQSASTGGTVDNPAPTEAPVADFGGKENFKEGYYAYALKTVRFYQEPDERSRIAGTAKTYEQIVVSEVRGDWCYARYKTNLFGYVRCSMLFMWDRIDPYAGEIPGLVIYPQMAFVGKTTNIYDTKDNTVLKTVNPGSAFCVEELDQTGVYKLPYYRTTGYVHADDVVQTMRVVPWEDAQPGDLISVMTTFYAVGISTINYQGRNWNIYLASSMISGTVLQPGEDFNQYQCIGPYRKSTGYHRAPIMAPGALWGYGGGTCQVNTTFYITNIQLPILVTHRKVHAKAGIYYCKMGFDAAVGGGDINLTLTNTMPYAIRYQYFMSDGVLTCCIFRES